MNPFIIERVDDTFYFRGALDGHADLSPLELENVKYIDPLKLNLNGLARCNSIGIQALLKLVGSWGDKKFEYYEATDEFLHQVEMIRGLLGKHENGTVQSVRILFEFSDCAKTESCVLDRKALLDWKSEEDAPKVQCPCDKKSTMQPENDDPYLVT